MITTDKYIYTTPVGEPPTPPRSVGEACDSDAFAIQRARDTMLAEGVAVIDVWTVVPGEETMHFARVHLDGGIDYAGPDTWKPVPPEVTS